MTSRHFIHKLATDRSGSTVVEFAIVGPTLVVLIIGAIYTSMVGFTAASLHYAVQAAARCESINTSTCSDANTTQTFAGNAFTNLTGATPTFNATSASCGSQVTGSISFTFNTGLRNFTIPLSSTACFPA